MALLNARRLLLERQRGMAPQKKQEDHAELDAESLFEFDKGGGWVKKGYEQKARR